jgi:hypothetical protein
MQLIGRQLNLIFLRKPHDPLTEDYLVLRLDFEVYMYRQIRYIIVQPLIISWDTVCSVLLSLYKRCRWVISQASSSSSSYPRNEVRGVYWNQSVCLSVCLSVDTNLYRFMHGFWCNFAHMLYMIWSCVSRNAIMFCYFFPELWPLTLVNGK